MNYLYFSAINKHQNSWTATYYDRYENLTLGDMRRRAGGKLWKRVWPDVAKTDELTRAGTKKKDFWLENNSKEIHILKGKDWFLFFCFLLFFMSWRLQLPLFPYYAKYWKKDNYCMFNKVLKSFDWVKMQWFPHNFQERFPFALRLECEYPMWIRTCLTKDVDDRNEISITKHKINK